MHIKKRSILYLLMLAAGLYCAATALWHLARTAIFVHEATVVPAVVVDMKNRPFESCTEALSHGNLPWDGDVAYQPYISCTLPTEPHPIPIRKLPVNDLDNQDYTTGQEIEVILPLEDPAQVHIYRFKFLWGGDSMLLLTGLALGAAGYLPLRRRKRSKKTAKPTQNAPKPAPKPVEEEPFQLESTPAPKKKRTRKPKAPKDPSAPAKPRRRKKSES